MVSRDTLITGFFALTAVTLWDSATHTTESLTLQLAILVGIGVVVPTLINEIRRQGRETS